MTNTAIAAGDNATIDQPSLQTLAVTKAIKTAAASSARDNLGPGEYDVDFAVRIQGTIRIGEDYETTVPNAAKPWNIVVAALTEINRLRNAAGEVGIDLDKLVAAAETMDPTAVKEAKTQAEAAAASLKEATRTTAKGKVTTNLQVLRLDETPLG